MPGHRALSILAAGAIALAAGCGDDEAATTTDDVAATGTTLKLTLDVDGGGPEKAQVETIECADPSDTEPDELCAQVLQLEREDFEPVSPNTACTEIYGGPDSLLVEGDIDGETIDGSFTRENGCEIDRFEVWVPILEEVFPGYKPGESIDPSGG